MAYSLSHKDLLLISAITGIMRKIGRIKYKYENKNVTI